MFFMTGATFAVLALFAVQQPEPIFPKLFPQPTGQNGLEEYVRAIDLVLTQGLYPKYIDYEASPERTLELKVQCALETNELARLVKQGNEKAIQFPLGHKTDTLGSLVLSNLGRVLLRRTEGLFVLGRTNDAFETLEAMLVFGRRIQDIGGALPYIRGLFILSYGLQGFHEYRHLMPLPTAERLSALSDDLMMPQLFQSAMVRDHLDIDRDIKADLTPDQVASFVEIMLGAERAKGLNEQQVVREFWQWLGFYRSEFLSALSKPENTWSRELDNLFRGGNEALPVGQALAFSMEELAPFFARSELRLRAQLRMLGVYGEIVKYKWLHGAYPTSIKQLTLKDAAIDPLTGDEFHYANQGATFDMYSSGIPEFGEVRVYYQRAR